MTSFGYDAVDRVTSVTRPGNLASMFAYDALGRVTDIQHAYDEKISGTASLPPGAVSVTISPEVEVTPTSFVLLTPKVDLQGRDLWFTTAPGPNTMTIRISSPRSTSTKVAWLLLG